MIIDGIYMSTVKRNEYTGYTVFKFKYYGPARDRYVIYVHATIPIYVREMPLRIEGNFAKDSKTTFFANKVYEKISDKEISIAYLSNKDFCGIGPKRAKLIVDEFGPDIFSVVNDPVMCKKLSKLKGFPENVASELIVKIRNTITQREVFEFMLKYYGTVLPAMRIAQKYKFKSLDTLRENPYICCMEFDLPFYTADAIARDVEMSYIDRKRIEAIIFEALRLNTSSGNTFAYQEDLNKTISFVIKNSAYRQNIPLTYITSIMVKCKWLYIDQDENGKTRVFLRHLYSCEYETARNINRLRADHMQLPFDENIITEIEKDFKITYHKAQKNAFNLLKTTGVKILTGGPGTGKTTLLNGIINAFMLLNNSSKVVLCSPTGRAAQRMSEQTGKTALTIHKLLEIKPFEDVVTSRDKINPIDADFIIVDEFSMIDVEVMSIFLNAIRGNTLVLFVGDIDQLPSVGPGNVMRDLIASGVIETYKLTAVYRQTSGSSIVDNANKIIKGNNNLSIDNTFSVVELNEEEGFNDKITQLFDEHPDFNIHNTQVLTTVKRDDGGTFSINNIIHKRFFAGREYFSNFGIGDKIIIGENDYTLGVYNGDMGFVTHILEDGVEVDINGEEKFIPSTSIDLMSLAYAITIHKSQGSEFENVIIALPDNISSMLQRNLLYTAITRAKKRVIILSKNNSFNTAIRQNSIIKRNTALAEKIVQRK